MVGEAGRQGSAQKTPALKPAVGMLRDPELEAQALMDIAEVVETADDVHARLQSSLLLGQVAGAVHHPE